jgi:hypothetical protein
MRFFLVLLLSVASGLAAEPLRVGVIQLGETDSPRVVAEKVGKLEGVEVVQAAHKLKEGQKESEVTKEERIALGLNSQVQLLIVVDINGEAFSYVDAATGEELFRIREMNSRDLANSAYVLVEELRDTLKAEAK